jgi:hypothetical protein
MLQGAIGSAWGFAVAAEARTSASARFPIDTWMALASVPARIKYTDAPEQPA